MLAQTTHKIVPTHTRGQVHCPICTHTVDANVISAGKRTFVEPGQRCPRCGSLLDAAYVLRYDRAA